MHITFTSFVCMLFWVLLGYYTYSLTSCTSCFTSPDQTAVKLHPWLSCPQGIPRPANPQSSCALALSFALVITTLKIPLLDIFSVQTGSRRDAPLDRVVDQARPAIGSSPSSSNFMSHPSIMQLVHECKTSEGQEPRTTHSGPWSRRRQPRRRRLSG